MNRKEPANASASELEEIPEQYRLSTYTYDLPRELIAQRPAEIRDQSRLLVLNRRTGELLHRVFRDLPELLRPSDILVINQTKVIPASLICRKPSGGRVELLVVDPAAGDPDKDAPASRVCLVKSSKPLRPGTRISMEDGPELLCKEFVAPGRVRMLFPETTEDRFLAFLERHGRPPLPAYIGADSRDQDLDRRRYQTIYGRVAGSVAAPTAGLHFTDKLIEELEEIGITIARIVLHVGPGTFMPVRTQDVRLHSIEAEYFDISEHTAACVSRGHKEGRRVIAVGTTSTRALETATSETGDVRGQRGKTDLFIIPGYRFKIVRGIVTNFHLPESTLLMLTCALGGTQRVMTAYHTAVNQRYRFYSYGDACLIID
ncbi:MAG: tRNA preQ1(34) S-adenosylmethionine ribosyltransferase-isomerase QueA [Desulfomonile tiedjei]|uniref:S-adenosylmethionine:tRNA ribosyltransferase-isomerase n=1 Tax=Desulfomonile tiedjei TaxID=2358 RepID=A0A9D6V5P6_9BACT|nr:tRNA preQ1(34) S-adenosylmethionine ribosyltransferase-isomerase QueA [Desulfomonile tiedjei]